VPSDDHLRAAKAALEELGFSVEEGAREGPERLRAPLRPPGAQGREGRLRIDRGSEPLSLLAELARGLDVEHEVVVAAEGGAPREAPEPARGRVKVVAFRSSEELAEELKRIAA